MTKEELADKLNGGNYRDEISAELEKEAKESGLIVIFGASDDLLEFRGAINDETGAYEGTRVWVYKTKSGVRFMDEEKYNAIKEDIEDNELDLSLPTQTIQAIWSPKGLIEHEGEEYDTLSWLIQTDIPHSRFIILEDEEPYCRGIIIDEKEITK